MQLFFNKTRAQSVQNEAERISTAADNNNNLLISIAPLTYNDQRRITIEINFNLN